VGIRDGRELAGWNPRLTFVEQTSALAGYAQIPLTPQRVAFRIFHALPIIRDYDRLYRFTF
jgi:hypothetical protein